MTSDADLTLKANNYLFDIVVEDAVNPITLSAISSSIMSWMYEPNVRDVDSDFYIPEEDEDDDEGDDEESESDFAVGDLSITFPANSQTIRELQKLNSTGLLIQVSQLSSEGKPVAKHTFYCYNANTEELDQPNLPLYGSLRKGNDTDVLITIQLIVTDCLQWEPC